MVIQQVERGGWKVNVYTLDVTPEMRAKALDFATKIIRTNNQYSRLLPQQVWHSNNLNLQQKIEIQRTYVGKLGEILFVNFLTEKEKKVNTEGMFEIYEGQENVDSFDFVTESGQSVDVKSGFRSIHTRLLVNIEQFDNIPKQYYVGVLFNGRDIDPINKIIDLDSITQGIVQGYAEYGYMKAHADVGNFGEGPARYLPYNRLMGIDKLVKMF